MACGDKTIDEIVLVDGPVQRDLAGDLGVALGLVLQDRYAEGGEGVEIVDVVRVGRLGVPGARLDLKSRGKVQADLAELSGRLARLPAGEREVEEARLRDFVSRRALGGIGIGVVLIV